MLHNGGEHFCCASNIGKQLLDWRQFVGVLYFIEIMKRPTTTASFLMVSENRNRFLNLDCVMGNRVGGEKKLRLRDVYLSLDLLLTSIGGSRKSTRVA